MNLKDAPPNGEEEGRARNGDAPPLGGIIIAAGESRRMGRFKPLLPLGSRTVLQRVADRLIEGGLSPILAVLGHRAEDAERCLSRLPVRPVVNDRYPEGMLSSVQCGVRLLPEESPAFFLALGDQPFLSRRTIPRLIRAWIEHPGSIVLPTLNGKGGHPVLFDRCYASRILSLKEPETLRDLVRSSKVRRIEIAIESKMELLDLDTPEDYEVALRSLAEP
jgi:CTP:molybdopterin cytidylyltransferase MocA